VDKRRKDWVDDTPASAEEFSSFSPEPEVRDDAAALFREHCDLRRDHDSAADPDAL
jgi:hypothetical protein